MKYLLALVLMGTFSFAFSQNDFLLLRKKGTVVHVYFKENYLQCQLSNGQWLEGRIKVIRNDSLFLDQMAVRQVGNFWGLPTVDTLRYGLAAMSLVDIHALPTVEKGVGIIKNGSLFTIGAAAYIGLNLFNGLVLKGEEIGSAQNLTNLGIAASVFMLGKILKWSHPSTIVLGKKYKLSTTATIPVN